MGLRASWSGEILPGFCAKGFTPFFWRWRIFWRLFCNSRSARVISEKPSDFLDDRFSPDEMDRKMILQKIESQRRSGESTRSLETHYHFKMTRSCSGFLIVLIGISLSHGAIRGGIARIFGIGLLLTFSYYVLLRMVLFLF